MLEFGALLHRLRTDRGLTLRALASATGVNYTYLSKVENGRLEHTPSIRTLQALAGALGTDELELMEAANKLPPVLAPFLTSPEAMQFLRRAGETVRSPKGWQDLLGYMESNSDEAPKALVVGPDEPD